MDTRYRWYRIQFPRDDYVFSTIIVANPFTNNSNSGFMSIDDQFGNPKYRFLKRANVTITVMDENGNPDYQQISTVEIIDFSIFSVDSFVFLRVENPGRSINDLLNAFEKYIGLGFTCSAIIFKKLNPMEVLANLDNTKLVGLKVSGTVAGETFKANLELVSNEGIVTEKIRLLDEMTYHISLAVIEVLYEGLRGKVSLSSSGLVKITGKITPKITQVIENALPKLI